MTTSSRTIVRQGIAAYFGGTWNSTKRAYTGGPISMLGCTRAATPKEVNLHDAFLNTTKGGMSGGWFIVKLPREREGRRTMAGAPVQDGGGNIIRGGWKQVIYTVTLDGYFISQHKYGEDAEADLDTLIESIKQQMRYDRTLGGICLDAGESSWGMRTSAGNPGIDDNERTGIQFQIEFEVRVNIVA